MNYRKAIIWAGMASGIFVSAGLLGFIGHLLDKQFGIYPWGLVIGLVLGMIIGLTNFIFQVSKNIK